MKNDDKNAVDFDYYLSSVCMQMAAATINRT
jgi:hypothetical protein